MVIYAMGGSEGTAVEAASRTGRRESGEKLLVKSTSTSAFSLQTSLLNLSLHMNTAFLCMCVHSTVHSCACNEKN